jgi:hypothetical protein
LTQVKASGLGQFTVVLHGFGVRANADEIAGSDHHAADAEGFRRIESFHDQMVASRRQLARKVSSQGVTVWRVTEAQGAGWSASSGVTWADWLRRERRRAATGPM